MRQFSSCVHKSLLALKTRICAIMRVLTFNILFLYGIVFLLVNPGESLRCRSGNQRSNDQVRKTMQTCRRKYSSSGSGNRNGNDYTSSENDSSDEDSTSSMSLDEELFFGNSNKRSSGNTSRNGSNNGQSSNGNNGDNRRNDRSRQDSVFNNRMSNPSNFDGMNERVNGMSNQNQYSNYHTVQSQNSDSNNNRRDRAECVTHCLFDELNLVDQRGFPERGSVMDVMTRGVQDPSLRDFIEESITGCFHYLESDTNNREKCSFSNNLMNCFADKARDRCEDWDNQ